MATAGRGRGRARIVVRADVVHTVGRPCITQASQPRQVVAVTAVGLTDTSKRTSWRRCAADDRGAGVRGFDGAVRLAQQVRVRLRADVTDLPLTVNVGLVPYLNGVGPGRRQPGHPVGIALLEATLGDHTGRTQGTQLDLETVSVRDRDEARGILPIMYLDLGPIHAGVVHLIGVRETCIADVPSQLERATADRRKCRRR